MYESRRESWKEGGKEGREVQQKMAEGEEGRNEGIEERRVAGGYLNLTFCFPLFE